MVTVCNFRYTKKPLNYALKKGKYHMWIISYFLKSKYEPGLVDVIKRNTLNMIHVHDNKNMQ